MGVRQFGVPQEHSRKALQNAPQLRPFILSNVKSTGKRLGEGAYGCVEELEVNGHICAGKRMYESLIDSFNEGADHVIQKYYDECQLLSNLQHPNIVQFTVDREIFNCRNFRLSNFRVKIFSSLQHTDEN